MSRPKACPTLFLNILNLSRLPSSFSKIIGALINSFLKASILFVHVPEVQDFSCRLYDALFKDCDFNSFAPSIDFGAPKSIPGSDSIAKDITAFKYVSKLEDNAIIQFKYIHFSKCLYVSFHDARSVKLWRLGGNLKYLEHSSDSVADSFCNLEKINCCTGDCTHRKSLNSSLYFLYT